MRKLLMGLVIMAATGSAIAGPPRHHYHHHHHGRANWVAPLIIGGVLGAVIANQATNAYSPPPVLAPPPAPPPYGYYYHHIYDYYCNCYRLVLVAY